MKIGAINLILHRTFFFCDTCNVSMQKNCNLASQNDQLLISKKCKNELHGYFCVVFVPLLWSWVYAYMEIASKMNHEKLVLPTVFWPVVIFLFDIVQKMAVWQDKGTMLMIACLLHGNLLWIKSIVKINCFVIGSWI